MISRDITIEYAIYAQASSKEFGEVLFFLRAVTTNGEVKNLAWVRNFDGIDIDNAKRIASFGNRSGRRSWVDVAWMVSLIGIIISTLSFRTLICSMARLLLCRILPKPEEINVFIFRTSNMKLLVFYLVLSIVIYGSQMIIRRGRWGRIDPIAMRQKLQGDTEIGPIVMMRDL